MVEQIRSIILSGRVPEDLRSDAPELMELQDGISYLSKCVSEAKEFLGELAAGNLDVKAPDRYNTFSGELKELHSSLMHIKWQADRIAKGDYHQSISFMGEFSNVFNRMLRQLSGREKNLKAKSRDLNEDKKFLEAIMDGLKDWVVVTSKDEGEIIYRNQSANHMFFDYDERKCICGVECELMARLIDENRKGGEHLNFEFECRQIKRIFDVRSFSVDWNGKMAYAHYISDITGQRELQKEMESWAYLDDLTNLFNRRYCYQKMQKFLDEGREFSFCMIDIDGLKFANDTFGHVAGDEYIKTVAEEMTEATRISDLVSRIGGDEFAIIFQGCDAGEALKKMLSINNRLQKMSSEYPMSISYGVVHISPGTVTTMEETFRLADERMYHLKNMKKAAEMKETQKDQLEWSEELETGNAQIDEEHRELFMAVNGFLNSCTEGRGKNHVVYTLEFLKEYTKIHFANEEELQQKYDYPEYFQHKKYHGSFVEKVHDFERRIKLEGISERLVAEITEQVCKWLLNHIKVEDMKVARHVRSKLK